MVDVALEVRQPCRHISATRARHGVSRLPHSCGMTGDAVRAEKSVCHVHAFRSLYSCVVVDVVLEVRQLFCMLCAMRAGYDTCITADVALEARQSFCMKYGMRSGHDLTMFQHVTGLPMKLW